MGSHTAGILSTVLLGMGLVIGCSGPQVSTDPEPTVIPDSTSDASTESPASPEIRSEVSSSAAASAAVPAGVFIESGVAIAGADPVAYFTEAAYVPGEASYTYDWAGATWQFASLENRDLFAADPQQYAPQYGGFCAWAVSQGYTAKIDPTAWKIVDGKLYLNYDQKIQQRWAQDIPGNIAKADQNWPAVLEP